jgi:hypothetical protein
MAAPLVEERFALFGVLLRVSGQIAGCLGPGVVALFRAETIFNSLADHFFRLDVTGKINHYPSCCLLAFFSGLLYR